MQFGKSNAKVYVESTTGITFQDVAGEDEAKELLTEMIDGLSEDMSVHNPDIIYEKVASMSCKAAVKGHHTMSFQEANVLIDQLLDLENPYACPHGRPTIISMSKYELEKKFKRIV